MNKEIKHLYQELSISDKEQLLKSFKQSPKMLLYIRALEEFDLVTTPKAVHLVYKEELHSVEDTVLINRFYKLRNVLRLHLLQQLKSNLKTITDEETELKFLKLLLLKNEHAYVLEKAKKLEKICWRDNLFELLPELISIIIATLHFHKSRKLEEIAAYVEKLDTANQLLFTINQFNNHINLFRLKVLTAYNYDELAELYNTVINKMRRKAKSFKQYTRFSLVYHYVSFSVGSQIQNIVHKSSNVLTRHLNQLDKLLAEHPNMPIIRYLPNHRFYDMNSLLINKAIFWFNKENSKKSYQCILEYEQLVKNNPKEPVILSGTEFHNILLCCWAAKEFEALLKYSKALKEFQLINAAVQHETPYFVYELLAYIGLYPHRKHPNPNSLILLVKKFLKNADENATWIYSIVGTFSMLYGRFDESRTFLKYPPLLAEHSHAKNSPPTLELLNIVEAKNKQELKDFRRKIRAQKKATQSREVLLHLNELEILIKHFL